MARFRARRPNVRSTHASHDRRRRDLGLALPAIVATCVGVRRGSGWARRALYGAVAWLGLVGIAVAGMAIAMWARGKASMSAGAAAVMTLLALGLAGMGVFLYAPVLRRSRSSAGPA
jgi:hypothetical protein